MEKRGSLSLTTKKLEWALDKWNSGYTWDAIAKALYVHPRTLKRNINIAFGSQNYKRQKPPLVYKED